MAFYFLMCSERSGSNLITKMMNSHKDVCGPAPKHIINPVARNLFRYKDLSEEKNWNELLDDIERLFNVDFSIWKTRVDRQKLSMLSSTGDIASLIKNLFLEEARANNKVHVFIKENQLYEFISFLLLHFPEAKYIYQVRDPRDMALSWKKSLTHRGGVISAAKQWKKDQMSFLKIHSLLHNQGKSFLVKYEDLISNTPQTLKEICQFLSLPYDPSMMNYYKDELTRVNSEKQTSWKNLSKSVMTENKEKYKKELTDDEIKCIEKICYHEMIYLNYQPINSVIDLDSIDERLIQEMEKEELAEKYNPNESVRNNMEAKKVFYQKVLF
jgi:hypothetical protein